MKFTVCFSGDESANLAFGLVFTPGPCWVAWSHPGADDVIVNMASRPNYMRGGLDMLFSAVPGLQQRISSKDLVVLVVHPEGYGTSEDLVALRRDLEDSGYRVVTVQ